MTGLLVGGTPSGLGKTTVTLAIVLASYVHLHFGANPAVALHFVGTLRQKARATA
jgi:cobyrinic acid a,c-diamide synthase